MKKCHWCKEEIQDSAIKCRYCGEWLENENIVYSEEKGENDLLMPTEYDSKKSEASENQIKSNVKKEDKIFSWKVLTFSFLIAFFISIIVSAFAGINPAKNIIWTVFWVYLTIEAWRYWKWKALLPYPMFIIVSLVVAIIREHIGVDYKSLSYLVVKIGLNIGGLIAFYALINNAQRKNMVDENCPSNAVNKDRFNAEIISTKEVVKGKAFKKKLLMGVSLGIVGGLLILALVGTVQKFFDNVIKDAKTLVSFPGASKESKSIDWFLKADKLFIDGKYTNANKAIEYLNKSIELYPDISTPYINRGLAYDQLGQYQRAIENFNDAIRLKSDDYMAYNNRGRTYVRLEKYELAIEDFNQAISLNPNNAIAYNNRALTYSQIGKHILAIDDFTKAIDLNPSDAAAYYSRGNVYGRDIGLHNLAIKDYTKAIELKPDFLNAYNNRALAYLMLGNKKYCCQDAQKACELGECKRLEWAKSRGYCQ